ncbi:glycoside hydrolase family 130 protein [Lewinella sp. W8]|uniref:glycoside hydrolase family 130 protein n=1 Tax=Lewinella sp. W8 TaxID=2528208 RepID=UPI0010685B0D|nr:glycoside hydrolase family 130 protein [Lewinella sp. W8]MTB49566.1 hypothetical protein [Lewinella sp. W8]
MPRVLTLLLPLLLCTCAPSPAESGEPEAPEGSPWIGGFEKPAANPILTADSSFTFLDPLADTIVRWQRADVFNPGAVTDGDSVYLFFRAEDNPRAILGGRTSRIGLAVSADGINFRREPQPVLFPANDGNREFEEGGGCEDPRVVEMPEGGYLMHYTAWNQDVARLCVATSSDMRNWTKHGPVFENAYGGKFHNTWSKSGSVVCELREDGRMVAQKVGGKYWMYWGDAVVGLAHSDDLLDWTPVLNPDSTLFDPLPRRRGKFDSGLSEPGPPALITPRGILVLYNGKNAEVDSLRSMDIGPGAYCGGQALFSPEDPTELLLRQDTPYIKPSLPHEMTGQYASGTTFTEALVRFRQKWYLYYGTADSMVGVAVSEDDR